MQEPNSPQSRQEHQTWQEWRQHVDATLQYIMDLLQQKPPAHTESEELLLAKDLPLHLQSAKDQQDPLHSAARIDALESEKNTLLQNLEALQKEKDRASAEREDWRNKEQHYNNTIATLNSDNAKLCQDIATERTRFEEAQKKSVADPAPGTWEKQLATLSTDLQALAEKYFETTCVHIFFVQCGQFNRLVQFWEACKRHILEQEYVPNDMAHFLEQLVALYNSATPQGEAKIITALAGATFDFDVCQRVGADGTRVQALLLPGLCNPAGKVLHKALVTLAR